MLVGATVWGLIWYPYRVMEQSGLGGLHAAILTYAVAFGASLLFLGTRLRGQWPQACSWWLLAVAISAGGCNLGYVLATLHGQVMRVLLLFYLSPLWTVLLSRVLLGERLNGAGMAVIGLSFAGAMVMLWHPELGMPWPGGGAEWLGLAAGFLFALSNVLIRKTSELSIELKSTAVCLGVVMLGVVALPFTSGGVAEVGDVGGLAWGLVVAVGVVLLVINLVVQYGLTHVAANQAIVIFLFELVVAAISSWLLAGESMGGKEWLGGAMIVGASLFSGRLGGADKETAP
ncbi:MAG: DMT family transporter [Rhodocyclaceae bacterium]|nr:DMT family transporter [Rhodocyclaceae bacterium]